MSTFDYMEPKTYVEMYHNLSFRDPVSGYTVAAEVTGYGSGWGNEKHCNRTELGPKCSTEFNSCYLKALRMLHHGNAYTACGSPFYFNQIDQDYFAPDEDFYGNTLIRTFVGKGSPDEITDTLRIALAIGRIGADKDANGWPAASSSLREYCAQFMTLDCNGLAGNYYGIDPQTAISTYATTARRRMKLQDIKQGDALVTITPGGVYEHMAIVQSCTIASGDPDGDSGKVSLAIVEWGDAGPISIHRPDPFPSVAVKRGTMSEYGLGYLSDTGAFRYFFAPPQPPTPRRWGLRGNPTL